MGNYVRTGPFTNGGAPGISATFLNNVENVLEQPSGGTEPGKYFLDAQAYTTGCVMSTSYQSLSRTTAPVSVTIDEADGAHNNCNAVNTAHLLTSSVMVYATSTTTVNNGQSVGGNLTFNF